MYISSFVMRSHQIHFHSSPPAKSSSVHHNFFLQAWIETLASFHGAEVLTWHPAALAKETKIFFLFAEHASITRVTAKLGLAPGCATSQGLVLAIVWRRAYPLLPSVRSVRIQASSGKFYGRPMVTCHWDKFCYTHGCIVYVILLRKECASIQ